MMLLDGGGAATRLTGRATGTRTALPHSGHLIAFPRAIGRFQDFFTFGTLHFDGHSTLQTI